MSAAAAAAPPLGRLLSVLSADELGVLVVAAREARATVAATPLLPGDWQGLAADVCELLAEAAAELERRERAAAGATAAVLAWRPRQGARR